MEFKEVVIRRSIRKFSADTVPKMIIMNVLEAGRWAPSASNCQPWHFIVISESDIKTKIALNCTSFSKEHWGGFRLNGPSILLHAVEHGTKHA